MGEKRRPDLPPVTYLDSDREVAGFLEGVKEARELAVDTEGASFHRFIDRVYLMQLSTREQHAIVDPLSIKPPAALGEMLADDRIEVVFHDADYDLRLLRQDYGWRVAGLFDTRVAAQLLGIRQFGLASLLEANFGVKLDKKHQRADWSMRPLPQDMLAYAAQDTMHLLALRDILHDSLVKKGRRHWAAEEFTRLQEVEWATEETMEPFLKMKGARDLTRRELAILRELFAWRDTAAAAMDRATFRILNNETLLDIARRAPTSPDVVAEMKGVPRGWSPAKLAELTDAVQRGLAVPEADLPRFPRGLRWDKDARFDDRANALRAVRDDAAAKLDLDPGVLCSRERLEAVARRAPATVDELSEVKGLRQWQIEVMGDAMVRALR